jgi:hypothetical protein
MPELSMSVSAGESLPMADDCMMAPQHERRDEGDEAPRHCPFAPTAIQGCTAAASLPAASVHIGGSPADAIALIRLDSAQHELLLAASFFHPPKA